MLQMMNRCYETEGQYHKSEETLATLRRAVDADLVSTHAISNCTVPGACLCYGDNVMTKAEYMIVVTIIEEIMMIKMMMMMTNPNNNSHNKSTGSANSHVCPAQIFSLQTGVFHVQDALNKPLCTRHI